MKLVTEQGRIIVILAVLAVALVMALAPHVNPSFIPIPLGVLYLIFHADGNKGNGQPPTPGNLP